MRQGAQARRLRAEASCANAANAFAAFCCVVNDVDESRPTIDWMLFKSASRGPAGAYPLISRPGAFLLNDRGPNGEDLQIGHVEAAESPDLAHCPTDHVR